MAYTKYSLTPANNNAAPPDGAPEGMLPSAVNDTMRDMMAQIRDVGDGIRGGTYTMTAPVITGGSVTGVTAVSTSGNLTFTGTSNRITGDFSNATIANRVMFQTSTSNSNTSITVIPNGTAQIAQWIAENSSTPLNNSFTSIGVDANTSYVTGGIRGTGTYLPLTFNTGGSERLRIDTSGNVGIGTSSPGQKLEVFNAAGGPIFRITSTATGVGSGNGFSIGLDGDGAAYLQHNENQPMIFLTNGANERMRITSSGNLLVGASTGLYTTGRINAMAGSGSAAVFSTTYSGDVGDPVLILTKYDNNSTTSQVYARFVYGVNISSGGGQINGNGVGAAAFGSFSDRRLKENIENLPSQIDNILALRPVEFDYKAGGHQIGFVAQEMQEVYPDAVGEDSDGMLTVTGWSKTEARLVKAIQELKATVDAQAARIAALESK